MSWIGQSPHPGPAHLGLDGCVIAQRG
ncbi:hypothetical protein SJA_C1-24880 [Sphingobium indicum UT26S]|uniref:Uncharacterized protein n=1 Tax=Sphingobium indicum (strain DSM 16413 / CCM 7287 / MTCC 6362 / UT26 / NBRC 101211 / UT26S) TaxID=452662 RepID=D4Z3Z0_SPHIU|nr:hypothetical protein SJA_C1-24880 [Sphingobium indicum UT26S]